MKSFIFLLALLSLVSLVIAENKKNGNVVFPIQLKIEQKFCERFGSFISKSQDWSSIRPNDLKQKHIFVGKSLSKYNSDDYSLWVDAYDVDGNNIDDLIAIDWHKRTAKGLFYLAYYVFADMGQIFDNRRELKKYFLSVKLQKRHGDGHVPWFQENILVRERQDIVFEESFVGFHEIEPVLFENRVFVVAKEEYNKTTKMIVFSFDAAEQKINLLCNF